VGGTYRRGEERHLRRYLAASEFRFNKSSCTWRPHGTRKAARIREAQGTMSKRELIFMLVVFAVGAAALALFSYAVPMAP
jgi:hypothetical protein